MNDRFTSRIVSWVLALLFFFSSATGFSVDRDNPDPTLEPPIWPSWVHKHWVWEHDGSQESAMRYVQDYLDHGIPIGAVNLDNPWDTEVGEFVPHPDLYPDMEEYIDRFHAIGVRVFLWVTCMVNEGAPSFQEGKDKGYFLSNGKTIKWWSGQGAFIDYSNPEALDWWHKKLDNVLNMGIDGWKVDGADPYVMLLMPAMGYGGHHITWNEYKRDFNNDFFYYTREKLGNDRVISCRPVNDFALRVGLPFVYTDREVNFAGWVGDNFNDWGGLRHALNDMLSSARFNFVSYGSDIGGFRTDGNKYKDVFIRWAQLGAFCPVMENGGGGEHRPWMFDDETSDIYRKFVLLHHELIPYIYSQAAYSYELVKPTMRPQPGTYQYMLGDDILVAPFFEEGNERTVTFPKGEWIYMFDESKVYTGGIKKLPFALDEFPVFIRKGAILPLAVTDDVNGHGSALSADYTTVLMYPEKGEKQFGLYEEDKQGTMITYGKGSDTLKITATASDRSLLFSVRGEDTPVSVVSGESTALPQAVSMAELVTLPSGWFNEGGITWYAVKDVTAGAEIYVTY